MPARRWRSVGANISGAGISVELSGNAATGTFTVAYDGTDTFTLTDGDGDDHTVQIDVPSSPVFEGTIDFANAGVTLKLNNFDHGTAIAASNTFAVTGSGTLSFQVGVSSTDTIAVNLDDVDATALGINGSSITTAGNATRPATRSTPRSPRSTRPAPASAR